MLDVQGFLYANEPTAFAGRCHCFTTLHLAITSMPYFDEQAAFALTAYSRHSLRAGQCFILVLWNQGNLGKKGGVRRERKGVQLLLPSSVMVSRLQPAIMRMVWTSFPPNWADGLAGW